MSAAAQYADPADAARAEAMVRALLPEGCEISNTNSIEAGARQQGFFGIAWSWPAQTNRDEA
jgi:hypothetical protein